LNQNSSYFSINAFIVTLDEENEYMSHLVPFLIGFRRTQCITSIGLFYKDMGFWSVSFGKELSGGGQSHN